MKCRKQLVLTGYRIQLVHLRDQTILAAVEELFATSDSEVNPE